MLHRLLLVEVANDKVVALLGAVALLAAIHALVRNKHRRVLAALAALGVVLSVADGVNTYYGYLPQVADVLGVVEWRTVSLQQVLRATTAPTAIHDRNDAAGAVLSLPVAGSVSGFGRHAVLVALPPQYFSEPGRRFPVVYLLHGSPGRPQDWLRANRLLTIAQQPGIAVHPMIFVMPPMSRGWLDDSECVNGQREHIETWLVQDVVPTIDALLRTVADRRHRALAGMSAGGFCALNLALRNSGMFSAALDMSGYTEPTYAGGVRQLFGPNWPILAAANTPARYLGTRHLTLPLHIRFDVGRRDTRPLRQIIQLIPQLTATRVDASLSTRGGDHTYHVWVPALRDGLGWLAAVFGADARGSGAVPPI